MHYFFIASAGAFVGNKIVEDGEECDCGYDDMECTDRCCYPRLLSNSDKRKNTSAKGCTRRLNTQCRLLLNIYVFFLNYSVS